MGPLTLMVLRRPPCRRPKICLNQNWRRLMAICLLSMAKIRKLQITVAKTTPTPRTYLREGIERFRSTYVAIEVVKVDESEAYSSSIICRLRAKLNSTPLKVSEENLRIIKESRSPREPANELPASIPTIKPIQIENGTNSVVNAAAAKIQVRTTAEQVYS